MIGTARIGMKIFFLAFIGMLALLGAAHAQDNAPYLFTILGPDHVVARVITTDATCPNITIDGNESVMLVRAAADNDFPVTVCDAAIAPDAKSASINGRALHLPKAKPQNIVVLGDTGCRLKGSQIQSCNDPNLWPWDPIADTAAQMHPDLVIHVGDYHYRESPCDESKANCKGSPYGDNWDAWDADLFMPGRDLLEGAPWVIVPGNHEDCQRAGIGYFRLLDPRPLPETCLPYTEPYAIDYMEPQLIVLDDSAVDDFKIDPAQLAEFQKQFAQINQIARGTSWMLMHDPMYVFGHAGEKDGQEQLFQDQLTLQKASNNTFPKSFQLMIGGHIHLFQVLSFGQGPDAASPPQMVVGNSGTLLDPPITTPLTGLEAGGRKVVFGTMNANFGFVVMNRAGEKWNVALKDVNGSDMEKCVLGNGALLCGQNALPATGADISNQWLLFAMMIGCIVMCGGIVLARRNS